ncbi:MAG: class I SAM-dependent methyltransferase [Candidatus Pacebacteria bacterium]|nr:class I SAM-dependent methyltransferase [Candidatus Paceibacterota bacterium]
MSIERLNLASSESSDILTNEHLLRYELARQFSDNKIILDLACGSGYGSNILAEKAKQVIGVDIDSEAIKEARTKYLHSNLSFEVVSALRLGLDSNSVDLIVSLETVEHFEQKDQIKFLQELKRVLKPDGLLIMSTPNSLASKHRNPWHLKELNEKEFISLLIQEFKHIQVLYQGTAMASVISNRETPAVDSLKANISSHIKPKYFIALASNTHLTRFIGERSLDLASLNGLAWQRKENNLGYRLMDWCYYRLSSCSKRLKKLKK